MVARAQERRRLIDQVTPKGRGLPGRGGPWGAGSVVPCAATPPPTGPSSDSVSSLSLQGRFGPSLVRGLLAVSLAANVLFTSAYLYQVLR